MNYLTSFRFKPLQSSYNPAMAYFGQPVSSQPPSSLPPQQPVPSNMFGSSQGIDCMISYYY